MANNPVQANPISQGIQVGNAQLPPEGPKALPYLLNFSLNASYSIDLAFLYSNKLISFIQSVYIDASECGDVTMTFQGSQQNIVAPAGSQGYYSVLSPMQGKIIVQGGGGTADILILNVPVPGSIWFPGGGPPTKSPAGGIYTTDTNIAAALDGNGAIKVDVTAGGGGGSTGGNVLAQALTGSNVGDSFGNYCGFNPGLNGSNQTITITDIKAYITNDCYLTGGAGEAAGWNLQFSNGGPTIVSGNVWIPGAAIADPLPGVTLFYSLDNAALSFNVNGIFGIRGLVSAPNSAEGNVQFYMAYTLTPN